MDRTIRTLTDVINDQQGRIDPKLAFDDERVTEAGVPGVRGPARHPIGRLRGGGRRRRARPVASKEGEEQQET
jgi:hypothetical protein